ncbi:MAG: hypothetical protein RLZZ630_1997 [Bacteroidota bacterium]
MKQSPLRRHASRLKTSGIRSAVEREHSPLLSLLKPGLAVKQSPLRRYASRLKTSGIRSAVERERSPLLSLLKPGLAVKQSPLRRHASRLILLGWETKTRKAGAMPRFFVLDCGRTLAFTAAENEKSPTMSDLSCLVGVAGFEPTTSCSQSRRDTGLRYTPKNIQKDFF